MSTEPLDAVRDRLRLPPSRPGTAEARLVPYDDAVRALGRDGDMMEYPDDVRVERIVGTVGRAEDFDAEFRLRNPQLRARWDAVAELMARPGQMVPRVELMRLGRCTSSSTGTTVSRSPVRAVSSPSRPGCGGSAPWPTRWPACARCTCPARPPSVSSSPASRCPTRSGPSSGSTAPPTGCGWPTRQRHGPSARPCAARPCRTAGHSPSAGGRTR